MACRALLTRSASTFQHVRSICNMPRPCRPGDGTPRAVTLIPGDGIGPLVTDAVEQVMKAMDAPIHFERFDNVRGDMERLPEEVVDSIRKNKVCLKGPLIGDGGVSSSLNTQLKKELHLFASVVNCASLPAKKRHRHVDITVIRESTEPSEENLKLCSERIAKYAFDYAYLNKLESVTAVHDKERKLADGLFLESCQKVATNYPRTTRRGWHMKYYEMTVDKLRPSEVMVTPYLCGDLVANAMADINGVTSVMTEVNVGADHAIFEQGASAGSNVGSEKLVAEKKANPMALLLSSALLLRHLHFHTFADLVDSAVKDATLGLLEMKDHGEESTTQEAVDEIIKNLDHYDIDRFSSGHRYDLKWLYKTGDKSE